MDYEDGAVLATEMIVAALKPIAAQLERIADLLPGVHDTLADIKAHSERIALALEDLHDETEGIGAALGEHLPTIAEQLHETSEELGAMRRNA